MLTESLANLTSHNKYTKNYCKFTENNIRTEQFIMEYLETYSTSSNWTSEERTRKLTVLADRINSLLNQLRAKQPEATIIQQSEAGTQTTLECRFEQNYLAFRTSKTVSFDDWQEEIRSNRVVIEMLKHDVHRLEEQLK